MASELRNIDLSLFYRLMLVLRLQGYWIDVTDSPMAKVTGATTTYNLTKYPGRPFVYLDEHGMPDPNGLTVKVDNIVIATSQYTVNYFDGTVTLNVATSHPVKMTGRISSFKVMDGYPEDDILDQTDLPIIGFVVDSNVSGAAFGIGTSARWRHRVCKIDILARTKNEAEDSLDNIQKFMEKATLYDMATNQPLTPDGALNPAFSPNSQILSSIKIGGLTGTLLRRRPGGSDKEKHRALIVLETESVS